MITITVNCNSDAIEIFNDETKKNIRISVSHPIETEVMIQTIFDTLYEGWDTSMGIMLERIDEDRRKTVSEW